MDIKEKLLKLELLITILDGKDYKNTLEHLQKEALDLIKELKDDYEESNAWGKDY